MKNFALCMMVVASFALAACESIQNAGNKELIGGGTGAVLGGVLGSKVGGGSGQKWATGVGVLAGLLVGSEIGKSLDKADMAYANQAGEKAHSAPLGEPIKWNNPESGNTGSVTAVKDGYTPSGRYCREYQQKVIIDGVEQSAYGTACRQPDGSWELVK